MRKNIAHDIFDRPVRKDSIKSKQKGNKNELECCKLLEKWTGEKFIRTPASGGRRLQNNSSFCGDVVKENEDFDFKFSVETKHYKEIDFAEFIKPTSFIMKVWKQATADAIRANKLPLVVLRKNGMTAGSFMVYFGSEFYTYLELKGITSTGYNDEIVGITSEDLLKLDYKVFARFIDKLCTFG